MKISKCLFSMVFLFFVTAFISSNAQLIQDNDHNLEENLKKMPLNGFFGITFTNSVPQGEFFDNIHKSGQGLSIFGGYHMDPVPFAFGLEADLIFNGSSESRTKWQWQDPFGYWHNEYDTASTQNMVIPVNVFARLSPNIGNFFFPYAEGFVGITVLNTSYTFNTSFNSNNTDYNNTDNETSVAFSYGGGAGFMIKIADFVQVPSSNVQMLFDVKMRYLKGEQVEYTEWKLVNDQFSETKFKSTTDMVLFMAGLTFRF
jgi:opacity protein-like surface antigen